MATKQGTQVVNDNFTTMAQWLNMTEADTGTAVSIVDFPDRTVQIAGTFGAGTITMQGSNDGTNWSSLHDFQDNVIALSDTSLALIAENPSYIRPIATAGSGMNVVVTIRGSR